MMSSIADQPILEEPKRGGGNKGLTQAYVLRDIAAQSAMDLRDCPAESLQDKATRARALRDCASVWSSCDDSIRIKRNRPLPGSLRPERPVKSKPVKSTAPMVLSSKPMRETPAQMPVEIASNGPGSQSMPIHAVSSPVSQPAIQPVTVRPIVPAIEPE